VKFLDEKEAKQEQEQHKKSRFNSVEEEYWVEDT
jgi:hypothetical protein